MKLENKEEFLKIYANLPVAVREEVILTIEEDMPISWNAAFFEVDNDTPLSKIILEKLKKLEII